MTRTFESQDFSDVYSQLIDDLIESPLHSVSPRGQKTVELTDVLLRFSAHQIPLIRNKMRNASSTYLAGELIWYYAGANDLQFIDQYSKFWSTISNQDLTCNSSYGHLLFSIATPFDICQYSYALKTLLSDSDSRRAYIHFARPSLQNRGSKDIPCTLSGIFTIRDKALHLSIQMRSSDMWYGIIYDVPFFVSLLQMMRLHLLSKIRTLRIGYLTLFLNSAHIYRKQLKTFEKMYEHDITQITIPNVEEPLITFTGAPTANVSRLYNYARIYSVDDLLNWLENHSLTNTGELSW